MASTHRAQINVEVDESTALALRVTAMVERTTVPDIVRSSISAELERLLAANPALRTAIEATLQARVAADAGQATVTRITSKQEPRGGGT